ncbi:MAG: hypothetical protein K2Q22_10850 [Cytophagales bacterium]|nr:hypothetical protein [Cytophagales bacterium]
MKFKKDNLTDTAKSLLRAEILQSAMASFKIEGISIPQDDALKTLKKVEVSLGK